MSGVALGATQVAYGPVEFASVLLDLARQVVPYIGAGVVAGFIVLVLWWGVRLGVKVLKSVGDKGNEGRGYGWSDDDDDDGPIYTEAEYLAGRDELAGVNDMSQEQRNQWYADHAEDYR